jgi:RNA polymerase sigma factor (sigma-70 family)
VSLLLDTYTANRELIERAIDYACRRHHLYGADAEDFRSIARLHLIDNDYAVLRAFRGQSNLQTYLSTVLTRCFLDWRIAHWGKWRPSAEARRMGPAAIQLERLLTRDGLSFDEACETCWANLGLPHSREQLAAMAARLPRRAPRTFVSADNLDTRPAVGGHADTLVLEAEAAAAASRAAAALRNIVNTLPPQDRLIIRMRFSDDFGISDIARALSLDAKPLYRRIQQLLADLRSSLEQAGITAELVVNLLDQGGFDFVGIGAAAEKSGSNVRPFNKGTRSPAQE